MHPLSLNPKYRQKIRQRSKKSSSSSALKLYNRNLSRGWLTTCAIELRTVCKILTDSLTLPKCYLENFVSNAFSSPITVTLEQIVGEANNDPIKKL